MIYTAEVDALTNLMSGNSINSSQSCFNLALEIVKHPNKMSDNFLIMLTIYLKEK